MVKRFSVIVVLCCLLTISLFAGSAAEKKLLSLVPANADGVLSIDLGAWLNLPAVRKTLTESPDISILKKRTGLVPTDLNGAVFWGSKGAWTFLVSTKKPFDPAKFFKAPEYICKKTTVDGKTLYTVTTPKIRSGKKGKKTRQYSFCVVMLTPGVTAFFQDPVQASVCLKAMKKPQGYTFPGNIKGSVRGFIAGGKEFDKLTVSCFMAGPQKDVFCGTLRITFASAQQAEEMRGQAMLMCNLLLIQSMKDNPELGTELMQQLNFDVQGTDVVLTVKLPPELMERLGKYAAKQKLKRKSKPTPKAVSPAAK